jgi:fumarate reductase subunit D
MQLYSGVAGIRFLRRLKPAMIFLVIVSAILLIPLQFWQGITSSELSIVVNNLVIALFLIVLLVVMLYAGISLKLFLKKNLNQSKPSPDVEAFMKRVSNMHTPFYIF